MAEDYSSYVKDKINELYSLGIDYGKSKKLLSFKGNINEEDIKKELLNFQYLTFTEKQIRNGEVRYVLYFVYSKKRGRVFVITFRDKIRLITIYPLGKTTLQKYFQKRFKKENRF